MGSEGSGTFLGIVTLGDIEGRIDCWRKSLGEGGLLDMSWNPLPRLGFHIGMILEYGIFVCMYR